MSILHVLLNSNKNYRREIRRKLVLGTTIGIAIGAAAAILLTPKAGKEIRDDLVKTAQNLPDRLRAVAESTQKRVEEMKERIMEKKAAIVDDPNVKRIADIAKGKVESFIEKDQMNKEV